MCIRDRGVAVPLASYLQRKFSVRTLLLGAFSLYLAGSLCDFLALNFPMLIVGRVLEAVATGILMPLVQTIAMTRFPANRHGTAMGLSLIHISMCIRDSYNWDPETFEIKAVYLGCMIS